jgi:L-seryl-tRNA(Ser) seleniumtransferase
MEALGAAIGELPRARVSLANDPKRSEIPLLALHLDEEALGFGALELVKSLQDGSPSIHANPSRVDEGVVLFGPMCLKEGEPEIVGKRVRALLGG